MDSRNRISELIYQSCMELDDKNFDGFLNLCDTDFSYSITAYSPEIRKKMTWLEHDKEGMKTLFTNLPRHNSDKSPITRHATVQVVKEDASKRQAEVVSGLQVFRTQLEGGATELFAVGRMYDTIKLDDDGPKLLNRNIHLETRMLGYGYHIPF
ncbi:MAG TPA: aromatic-ring-hydroxylating dioxygenase subunit beta [Burkholderiaceae bacterium]|jgi:methanesulfonate monooxygenase small subunit|nr:aromatic-ring-hydroxylating dioxygenase subunit beta [Burkholderiaceae bacterium]